MPGTIQVSVLDFGGLQSSSQPSQISVKVSMGKREYQTLDKGDFSFPLTTFRDNFVVTLHDAEGNEISHAGVETRKVVEKGVLDEMFPLEGGGHVHMKLQFLLSDQDRQRIRTMRELAMKKKNKDLLNSELRSPERVIAVDSKVAPSVQPKHEMSDSQKRPLESEVLATKGNLMSNPRSSGLFKKGKSSPEDDEGSQSIQKRKTNPADTNTLPAAFVPSKEVCYMSSGKTSETAASSTEISLGTTHLKESSHLESSVSVAASEDKIPVTSKRIEANDQQKQSPLKKSSSVRNMISAFESSQNQDMTPKIRSLSTKSELSKAEVKVPPKNSEFNEVEMEKNRAAESESGVRNPVNSADLLQNRECIRQEKKSGSASELFEATSSQDTRQFEELRAKHLQTSSEDMVRSSTGALYGAALPQDLRQIEELRAKHVQTPSEDTVRSSTGEVSGATVPQDMERSYSGELSRATLPQDMRQFEELRAKDMQTSSENSVRSSTGERASVSGRKPYNNQLSRKSFSGKQHPDRNLGAKNGGKGTKLQNSQRDYSGGFPRNQHQSSEIYGSWIFPGEGKHLCLTTAGKETMNLMGALLPGDESEPGETSYSTVDNVTQFEVMGGTSTDVEVGNSSQRLRNSELEDSAAGAENPGGPLGQVMRVVIMVGFATLVFLTRQKKPR